VANTVLTLLSGLVWWVLYSSVAALIPTLVAWLVLRWLEKSPVVFNRAYFASLLWTLAAMLMAAIVVLTHRGERPPGSSFFVLPWMRATLVADMLIGAVLLWRLVPRVDARRIRPTSACMAVAIVMVIGVVTAMAVSSHLS
jgi:hypothetical protein